MKVVFKKLTKWALYPIVLRPASVLINDIIESFDSNKIWISETKTRHVSLIALFSVSTVLLGLLWHQNCFQNFPSVLQTKVSFLPFWSSTDSSDGKDLFLFLHFNMNLFSQNIIFITLMNFEIILYIITMIWS